LERTPKRQDVAETVAERVYEDRIRLSDHALDQMRSLGVMPAELRQVLASGWHNPDQDQWKADHDSWAYAIEGETIDGRSLRVPVSFVEANDVLVVTVIDIAPLRP
jgi:phosphoserine aminotransferase